ncbi:MAG: hypothetical protein K6G10_06950 [Butyrivibrio sp.]|nr:hypothetical protein [Butyrivibrio sp.]
MSQTHYRGFSDIILIEPDDHYNASKISYQGHTWFESLIEDWLWDEFEYEKYGKSYEESVVGDDFTKEIAAEFGAWIQKHTEKVYEWLESAIQGEINNKEECIKEAQRFNAPMMSLERGAMTARVKEES